MATQNIITAEFFDTSGNPKIGLEPAINIYRATTAELVDSGTMTPFTDIDGFYEFDFTDRKSRLQYFFEIDAGVDTVSDRLRRGNLQTDVHEVTPYTGGVNTGFIVRKILDELPSFDLTEVDLSSIIDRIDKLDKSIPREDVDLSVIESRIIQMEKIQGKILASLDSIEIPDGDDKSSSILEDIKDSISRIEINDTMKEHVDSIQNAFNELADKLDGIFKKQDNKEGKLLLKKKKLLLLSKI